MQFEDLVCFGVYATRCNSDRTQIASVTEQIPPVFAGAAVEPAVVCFDWRPPASETAVVTSVCRRGSQTSSQLFCLQAFFASVTSVVPSVCRRGSV